MWTKFDHLDSYHFLIALEDQGVTPDAIAYVRKLVSQIEERQADKDEFDKELQRLQEELDDVQGQLDKTEQDLLDANDEIDNLRTTIAQLKETEND